ADAVHPRLRGLLQGRYCSLPRGNGIVAVEGAFVIVADRFQNPRTLDIVEAEAEGVLMKLERLRHGKPLAGYGTCGQQCLKRSGPQLGAGPWIVGPGEVGILAENRLSVMVGDQFGEFL